MRVRLRRFVSRVALGIAAFLGPAWSEGAEVPLESSKLESSKKGTSAGPAATLIGFRETGQDSALVYVQLTQAVDVRAAKKGRTLTFVLKGVSVPRKNNRYPLNASQFHSIVESARLVPTGDDTELVVELKRDGRASTQLVPTGDGVVLEVRIVAAISGTQGGKSAVDPSEPSPAKSR